MYLSDTALYAKGREIYHELAVRLVNEEIAQYKLGLERNRTKYKIVEETVQPDGSVVIKMIKQYNQSDVGEYLD